MGTLTVDAGTVTAISGTPDLFQFDVKGNSSLEQAITSSRENGTTFYEQTLNLTLTKLDVATQQEIVTIAKYLGITLSSNLKFDEHIKITLAQCSQRLYLLNCLKNQGLPKDKLDIIFNALIVSKLQYALPSWGGFLSLSLCNQIDAFFKRAHKYNVVSLKCEISVLLEKAEKKFFKTIQSNSHCLAILLPPKNDTGHNLRHRRHSFVINSTQSELHKKSFINRCIFKLR